MIETGSPSEINPISTDTSNPIETYREILMKDLWTCLVSREASLMGRKEVLTGKAKFGIFGDGKEVVQVALARAVKKGDWRSGYYRDQTLMMALGECDVETFFSQLYADCENDPHSGGRQMNSHFASKTFDPETGNLLPTIDKYNTSADVSCTAGQMARALGLALASKKYRENPEINKDLGLSHQGNELSYCTIGDSSTSEGIFWETMNAASVMKVPLMVAVYDDGYGISVPVELQTTKGSISRAMEGLLIDENGQGMYIYTVKGWDYPSMVATFEKVARKVREEHIPALVHVQELTQPQGHSTSGSHERYKSKERLAWERAHDCNDKMVAWMLEKGFLDEEKLEELRIAAKKYVRDAKNKVWSNFMKMPNEKLADLNKIYLSLTLSEKGQKLHEEINSGVNPFYSEVIENARRLKIELQIDRSEVPASLEKLISDSEAYAHETFHTYLYSESPKAATNIPIVPAVFSEDSKTLNGYQILNSFFDKKFEEDETLLAFGEDVGQIGDVNQGFAGLQEKYGKERVFDAGIREWSIIGQGIGLGIRGFRPIAEIQYLDYLVYAMSALTDDLACLRYRSANNQRSTCIVRSRGHRLEGIWHSGSPLGMIVNSLRGMVIACPRNMVQAAGIYNTLMKSDDPALVIESLNGYRLKEMLPDNISEFTVPVGMPEVLVEGSDVTLVTYGSCVRIALNAADLLAKAGIQVEVIDVQTLLPFDLDHIILSSIKKTNKILFFDEDVPGGATGFMMQEVLEKQGAYNYLDCDPQTLTAHAHRPPFGSDGDYFTKPGVEDVFDKIYKMIDSYQSGRLI